MRFEELREEKLKELDEIEVEMEGGEVSARMRYGFFSVGRETSRRDRCFNKEENCWKTQTVLQQPFTPPYMKIKDWDKTYSVRVGDYKVIFILSEGMKCVLKIDKWSKAYDRV